jgi:hypothetical protein
VRQRRVTTLTFPETCGGAASSREHRSYVLRRIRACSVVVTSQSVTNDDVPPEDPLTRNKERNDTNEPTFFRGILFSTPRGSVVAEKRERAMGFLSSKAKKNSGRLCNRPDSSPNEETPRRASPPPYTPQLSLARTLRETYYVRAHGSSPHRPGASLLHNPENKKRDRGRGPTEPRLRTYGPRRRILGARS